MEAVVAAHDEELLDRPHDGADALAAADDGTVGRREARGEGVKRRAALHLPVVGVAEGAEERRSRGPGEPARPDRDAQREVVGLRVAAVVDEATDGLGDGVWCCRHHESFYRICYRIDALEAACCGAPHLSKACGCCLGCASLSNSS